MAEPSSQRYQRLPGTGYRQLVPTWAMLLLFFAIGIFVLLLRGRRVQLWRGEDHLLIVDWDGYREYYKRINYRDIQSVTVHRTTEALITNLILGVIVLGFVGLGVLVDDSVGTIILCGIGGVFGLILLGNLVQGPSCKCQLRTAVQSEELPALARLPNARKALDQLRPLIVAAQGGALAPAEVPHAPQAMAPIEGQIPAPSSSIGDDPNVPPRMTP